jgi:hypothetical protein
MFQNTIVTPCQYTCAALHDHGIGFAELTWLQTDPLAVAVKALTNFQAPLRMPDPTHSASFTVARDTLYTAVRSGKSFGCPVVGEGDVTCKVMPHQVTALSIRWKPGYTMLVDRDIISRWIDETYTIVPRIAEDEIINMSGIIEKILRETK